MPLLFTLGGVTEAHWSRFYCERLGCADDHLVYARVTIPRRRMLIRLRDIPQLPKSSFSYRNGCAYNMVPTPAHLDTATGRIAIAPEFHITGWCARPPEELMHGRKGQIAIMFFSPKDGEIWQHYPLFDKDERDAAVFECVLPPLVPAKGDV